MSRRIRIDGVLMAVVVGSIAAAAVVSRAAGAPPAPPEQLTGLMAPDIPGVSASPQRVWRATLATFRSIGLPAPAAARWEYLPWDVPVTEDGQTLDGVADVRRNLVRINPMVATGDGRALPVVFAHEVAHLTSFSIEPRGKDDEADEAAAEALARDLVPVIRRRLRLDPLPDGTTSYQQQVNPFIRGTFRACRHTMPRARAHRVEQCARHTRRAFLLMDQANRAHALQVWGIHLPAIAPREDLHAWIQVNPARTRTIGQQLTYERQRWAAERAHYRRTIRALAYQPDAEVAFQLAGLAYGQDWRQLRACALSEGYRGEERYQVVNARPNKTGSGATGAFQFIRSTFLSTPQGRAGLDWHRIDVQAHAAAWMWTAGRRGEWTGKDC